MSKYRTSSYSSDFFVKCILVLLARRDSIELCCPETALILHKVIAAVEALIMAMKRGI